jgi:hypothetical protein
MHGRFSAKQLEEKAQRSIKKKLREPWRAEKEAAFAKEHELDTYEELYEYMKNEKRRLGRRLKRAEFIGYAYVTKRLGPWDGFMRRISEELRQEEASEAVNEAENE